MPTTKINVVHLLDHGVLTASRTEHPVTIDTADTVSPAEAENAVMAAARRVSISARAMPTLARAVLKARNPAQVAASMINARHTALGGSRGFLGAPTTPVKPCPDKKGYFRHYRGGSIYWHPYTGAHEVHGAIRQRWSQLGWERSFLGYPTTDETTGDDINHLGRYNHFQRGSIYWHPKTGAHEVHGAIRAKYLELGAEASFLGYPITDETATPDRRGRFNHFQAGSIYWTRQTGAHEVHGLIRSLWAEKGWERNPQLGYPISDELIPHRGIGHTRAPRLRKPLRTLPADVVRLPEEQPSPTLSLIASASALNTPLRMVSNPSPTPPAGASETDTSPAPSTRPRTATNATVATRSATDLPLAIARPGIALRPGMVAIPPVVINPARSHKGQSQDRYSDFEDGVIFWIRGGSKAIQLAPRAVAPNGERMAWTANEIVQLATVEIRKAIGNLPGATLTGTTFIGTTGYSWDGSGVRNRAHRIRATLSGMRLSGFVPVPATAAVEIRAEVSFDPVDREIVLYLTYWRLLSTQGNFIGGGDLDRDLHSRLDPALWRQSLITRVPGTTEDPIAVLSVKTQADGDVVVYFEP